MNRIFQNDFIRWTIWLAIAIPISCGIAGLIGRPPPAKAQPIMPTTPLSMNAQVSVDPYAKFDLVRDASTNDTAIVSVTRESLRALLPSDRAKQTVNKAYYVGGAKNVEIRTFAADTSDSSADNGTFNVTIYGWSDANSNGSLIELTKGQVLDITTNTAGSDATTNFDPMGYDATTNGGWYEVDTFTVVNDANSNSLTNQSIFDAAGNNRGAGKMFDPRGRKWLYFKITDMSGVTNVRIWALKVS